MKAKSRSVGYSPHHIPDLTLLHGAPDKSHILIDVVGPSVVTDNIIDASSAMPRAAAAAAESAKFDMFGDVRPHTVLPFAVEDGGALGIEALKFFHQCKDACGNGLNTQDSNGLQWTSKRGLRGAFLTSSSSLYLFPTTGGFRTCFRSLVTQSAAATSRPRPRPTLALCALPPCALSKVLFLSELL